jgi:hypothetical protein
VPVPGCRAEGFSLTGLQAGVLAGNAAHELADQPALESVRSMELLDRLLPRPPAQLLDVGGGPGTYAAPLARRGYRVHLVNPVLLHVDQVWTQFLPIGPLPGLTFSSCRFVGWLSWQRIRGAQRHMQRTLTWPGSG